MNTKDFLSKNPSQSGIMTFTAANKIIALIVIFAGIWISTQVFAYYMGYSSGILGDPLYVVNSHSGNPYPLYFPLSFLLWFLQYWSHTDLENYLYDASKWMLGCSIFGIVYYAIFGFIGINQRDKHLLGTAKWANKSDLKKAGLLGNKGGVIIGELADARLTSFYDNQKDTIVLKLINPSQKIVQSGVYNTLLAAPTRSGKGVSSVVPTCLSYPGSVIVLDFKGENFDLTSGFRSKLGRVYRWAPMGDVGHHFNPMMEIRGGTDTFSDANLIADILTTPSTGNSSGNANSEHFRTAAKEFLTSVIIHCLTSDWPDKSLSGCSKFLSEVDPNDTGNKKFIYDKMINSEHCSDEAHQQVLKGAGNQAKRPDDEGGSVMSTVSNALSVFSDAHIKLNTVDSEFFIDEFEKTDRPISLYITVPYSDILRISPLIRMFVTLFSRKFTSGETKATNRKFKVPLLFILDEFDKLGKMDELHTAMGIHNGYGIHYFLIIQSLNQLYDIYGKNNSFLAHCRNTVFFATPEIDSAEIISRICGKESVYRQSVSYTGNRTQIGFSSRTLSGQEQERSLISADQVTRMPLDCEIVLTQANNPYIAKKCVYYNDYLFKKRLMPTAFTQRYEAVRLAKETIEIWKSQPKWYEFTITHMAQELGSGKKRGQYRQTSTSTEQSLPPAQAAKAPQKKEQTKTPQEQLVSQENKKLSVTGGGWEG